MPTAICQMKNSHLPIFEQDKVLTWQKLLLRDFQKGLFLKQEWFSVKCLLASAIEIALNLNEIWLSGPTSKLLKRCIIKINVALLYF